MRDIWNPWHGCKKISEGCQNCYMYFLDEQRNKSGADIFKVKNNFDYPLHRDKKGNYKIKSGEFIRVCMTSDFFLEEADEWRPAAWEIIKSRPDVVFILITKRIQRIRETLPEDWNGGWENVWLNATCENQKRADERIPILFDLPFKHKGISVTPFIGKLTLGEYLQTGKIENVWCGGENYAGSRPLYYEWVKTLSDECKKFDVTFEFFESGNIFIKDAKKITFVNKREQTKLAFLCNLNHESSKPQIFNIPKIEEPLQIGLFSQDLPPLTAQLVGATTNQFHLPPFYQDDCKYCVMKKRCAGCSKCGHCS